MGQERDKIVSLSIISNAAKNLMIMNKNYLWHFAIDNKSG